MKVVRSRHCFPRHWHETYVMEVLEEGRNEFWCNGKTYLAEPGDIIVIHPGEIHTGYALGWAALTYRSCYPSEELMVELGYDKPQFRTHVIRDKSLARTFLQAHRLMEGSNTNGVGRSLMVLTLHKLIARYADRSGTGFDSPELSFAHTSVKKAIHFLSVNYCESISLTNLSSICGLSEFHFIRTFKKLTGLAPYEYVIASRVEQSRKLLSKGMSIAEVAAHAGFYDQSHLNRHFKRILGITPGKYACSMPSDVTATAP